jgi:hypothetical protein
MSNFKVLTLIKKVNFSYQHTTRKLNFYVNQILGHDVKGNLIVRLGTTFMLKQQAYSHDSVLQKRGAWHHDNIKKKKSLPLHTCVCVCVLGWGLLKHLLLIK